MPRDHYEPKLLLLYTLTYSSTDSADSLGCRCTVQTIVPHYTADISIKRNGKRSAPRRGASVGAAFDLPWSPIRLAIIKPPLANFAGLALC